MLPAFGEARISSPLRGGDYLSLFILSRASFRMREPQLSSLTWLPRVACTATEIHTLGSDCPEADSYLFPNLTVGERGHLPALNYDSKMKDFILRSRSRQK